MKRALKIGLLLLFAWRCRDGARGQVLVSMQLMSSVGTAAEVGRGKAAYTWNIHVCGLGRPVPFDVVRFEFPEVRLYSKRQQDLILTARVAQSAPARILKITGYLAAAGGTGVSVYNAVEKTPASFVAPAVSAVGLAIPVAQAMASKATPNYQIVDAAPEVIVLGTGQCADYTALAAFGTAAVTVGPRRVDPILGDPLKK